MTSTTKRFFTALDLGQVFDFSTLAVIERVEQMGEWDPVLFAWKKRTLLRLRYLERIPLGTPLSGRGAARQGRNMSGRSRWRLRPGS